MATVRRWQSQVDQAPLAQPRPVQRDTSGLRALAQGVEQVSDVASRAAARELEKDRAARERDAAVRLATQRQEIEATIQQQKGKTALEADLVNQSQELLSRAGEQIAAEFGNDGELAARFARHQQDQALQLRAVTQGHVAREAEAFQVQTYKSALGVADVDAQRAALPVTGLDGRPAVADPEGIARAIETKRAQVAQFAQANGWDDKARQLEEMSQLTSLHVGVVDSLLKGDAPQAGLAVAYLNAHRAEMAPAAVGELETRVRARSQEARAITSAAAAAQGARSSANPLDFDLGKANATVDAEFRDPKTGAITDPLAWKASKALVEDQYQQNQRAIQAKAIEAYQKGLAQFLVTRRTASIDRETWDFMTNPANKALDYAERLKSWEDQDRRQKRADKFQATPEQNRAFGALLTDMYQRPGFYKDLDYAAFDALWNPRKPDGTDATLALPDFMQAQMLFAQLHGKKDEANPEMDYATVALEEIAARYAIKRDARGGTDPKNPASWQPAPREVFDRVMGRLKDEAQRLRTDGKPLDRETALKLIRAELVPGKVAGTGLGSGQTGTGLGATSTTRGEAAIKGQPFIPDHLEGIPDEDLVAMKKALGKRGVIADEAHLRQMWEQRPGATGGR